MKPSTKGFCLGMIAGAVLTVVLEVLGLVGFGLLLSSGLGGRLASSVLLRSPSFPAADSLPDLGRADYDWTLETLEGDTVPFSRFEGQVVFLNVWATWCGPCVMELPSLEKLRRSSAAADVALVIVSPEDAAAVRAFVENRPLDLPLYVAADIPDVFEGRGVPTTTIIDRRGTVVFRHSGAARWDGEGCRDFLQGLAN